MRIEKPAKFTLVRLLLIPLFMIFMVYDFGLIRDAKATWPRMISASCFILAVIAYYVDKKLMGLRDSSTGYWRFLDVVADKLVIFGALLSVCFSGYVLPSGFFRNFFFWSAAAVMLRELAVMGISLTEGEYSAKDFLGNGPKFQKALFSVNTAVQMLWIVIVVLEPTLLKSKVFTDFRLLSLLITIVSVTLCVYSGLYSIMMYKNHLDALNQDD